MIVYIKNSNKIKKMNISKEKIATLYNLLKGYKKNQSECVKSLIKGYILGNINLKDLSENSILIETNRCSFELNYLVLIMEKENGNNYARILHDLIGECLSEAVIDLEQNL